jgi:hypothetical protein
MKNISICFGLFGLLALGSAGQSAPLSDNMAERVRVQIESAGLHPGMEPGMYVCAAGHLHIKGTVENLTETSLGKIKVGGQAFDADGNLLGTATASTKKAVLLPGARAEINVEFLTVSGAMIEKVKRHELTVLEAPSTRP